MTDLAPAIRAGDRQALARAITLVESTLPSDREAATELLSELGAPDPPSIRLGISGVPGVGKSTFIDQLVASLLDDFRVAILAVDPSSTKTGGSILGDKTRMGKIANDPRAFIRPSPSAGTLGGVARTTREVIHLVEAAGYDVVIVETVGVGQSEVTVAGMVDVFLLLSLARTGDSLQGIKRGVLEVADVIAINKADGDHVAAAKGAARELNGALRLLGSAPPVLTCSGLTGTGLDRVWTEVQETFATRLADGSLAANRARQAVTWLWSSVEDQLMYDFRNTESVAAAVPELQERVATGKVSVGEATNELINRYRESA